MYFSMSSTVLLSIPSMLIFQVLNFAAVNVLQHVLHRVTFNSINVDLPSCLLHHIVYKGSLENWRSGTKDSLVTSEHPPSHRDIHVCQLPCLQQFQHTIAGIISL